MWATIQAVVTFMLPFAAKFLWWLIAKKETADQLKKDMIVLIDNMNKDIPIQLHDKYNDQVARIKEQLEKERLQKESGSV